MKKTDGLSQKTIINETKNMNILYVEDDKAFHQETLEVLNDYFKNVCSCFNGEEGLEEYKRFFSEHGSYFDLVITDLKMPVLDGLAFSNAVLALNKSQQIVVVSAHNEAEYLIELINTGIKKFLLKPFKHVELLDILHKVVCSYQNNIEYIDLGEGFLFDMLHNILLSKDHSIVHLTRRETIFMKFLIKNCDRVVTLEEIYNILWDDNKEVATEDALNTFVSRLRKKIKPIEIETFHTMGYKLKRN